MKEFVKFGAKNDTTDGHFVNSANSHLRSFKLPESDMSSRRKNYFSLVGALAVKSEIVPWVDYEWKPPGITGVKLQDCQLSLQGWLQHWTILKFEWLNLVCSVNERMQKGHVILTKKVWILGIMDKWYTRNYSSTCSN
jgi:hypothetical protein